MRYRYFCLSTFNIVSMQLCHLDENSAATQSKGLIAQVQMLVRAVEDMFASPAFLASQMRCSPAGPPANGSTGSSTAPAMDLQSIDELYTALLKVELPYMGKCKSVNAFVGQEADLLCMSRTRKCQKRDCTSSKHGLVTAGLHAHRQAQ